jgi:Ca2+-transporting ATPase
MYRFDSGAIGETIAFTSFVFCLIVAAFECRDETATVFTTATFDSKQFNRVALGEFVLALLVTQMDVLRHALGTAQLTMGQIGWALVPAVALLFLWEAGKLLTRRRRRVAAAGDRAEPTGHQAGR